MQREPKTLVNLRRLFGRVEARSRTGLGDVKEEEWKAVSAMQVVVYAERELDLLRSQLQPYHSRRKDLKHYTDLLSSSKSLLTQPASLSSPPLSELRSKLFGLSASASTPSFEESQRINSELQQEMLDFAREMKLTAQSFSHILHKDSQVLSSIASHQYRYISEVHTEAKNIDKIQVKTDWFATLKSMLAAMFAMVLFFVMLGFIWMFPRKSYVYIETNTSHLAE